MVKIEYQYYRGGTWNDGSEMCKESELKERIKILKRITDYYSHKVYRNICVVEN